MSSLLSLRKLADIQNYGTSKQMTLVLFSSPGCAPCKILHPIIERVAQKYPENIGFLYVEFEDDNPGVFEYFNISGVPSIILFRGVEPIAFQNGFRSEASVIDWLADKLV